MQPCIFGDILKILTIRKNNLKKIDAYKQGIASVKTIKRI